MLYQKALNHKSVEFCLVASTDLTTLEWKYSLLSTSSELARLLFIKRADMYPERKQSLEKSLQTQKNRIILRWI